MSPMRPIRSSMEPGLGRPVLENEASLSVDEAELELCPAEIESGMQGVAHGFFPMTA